MIWDVEAFTTKLEDDAERLAEMKSIGVAPPADISILQASIDERMTLLIALA